MSGVLGDLSLTGNPEFLKGHEGLAKRVVKGGNRKDLATW